MIGRNIILVLKLEIDHSTTSLCVQNIAVCIANSVATDQTPRCAASDLGLMQGLLSQYLGLLLRAITVILACIQAP